jgi:Rrf2 family protein
MLYRRSAQLALKTSLLLALEPEGRSRRIRELADQLGVAPTYLTKIVQNLTRVGLLHSVRGPGGGVQLARPPREIHPWEILTAVEPARELTRCFLGLEQCNAQKPCPLHEVWAPARERVLDILKNKNLQEFAAEIQRTAGLSLRPDGVAGESQEVPHKR